MTDTTTTPGAIFDSIKERIATAQTSGAIVNRVADAFAEREISRRTKLLTDGFDKLTTLTKSYDDINKPDDKKFTSADPSAQPVLAFSEKRRGEITKAKKSLDKLTEAVTTALAQGNYEPLEKALKGGGNDKGGEAED